jgi:leucyl aminopeptidase
LFLRRFIKRTKAWAHAWTPNAKPGRPEGAEVLAVRLL